MLVSHGFLLGIARIGGAGGLRSHGLFDRQIRRQQSGLGDALKERAAVGFHLRSPQYLTLSVTKAERGVPGRTTDWLR